MGLSFASGAPDAACLRGELLRGLLGEAGAQQRADAPPGEQERLILEALRDWDGLLLLDNYESILQALEEENGKPGIAPPEASAAVPPPLSQWVELLDTHFDREELRTLCLHLGVDYDNLPAEGKVNKARELVRYLQRCNRLHELAATGKQLGPHTSWE